MADQSRSWWSRNWRRIAIVVGVLVVLFIGGSAVAARFTESNKFCGTDCHEMWPYRDTWAISTHKHRQLRAVSHPARPAQLPQDQAGRVARVWVHFTGLSQKPITVTRHIPNAACDRSGCHTTAQTSTTLTLGTPAPVAFKHGSPGHTQAAVHRVSRRSRARGRPRA